MAALKPWYQVATPREDLRKGQPLDASEFAIHLDQVMDGRAPRDYREPERFFARTYLTAGLRNLAVEMLRRLSGDMVGTSPVINLTTQFGGGKTHALALLYHLARAGEGANGWPGVSDLLERAGIAAVPEAAVAAFIGNRFDFITGSGGGGEPRRKTPWGDIAWQLGGPDLFALVEQHDREGVVPGGEVVQALLADRPTVILMDEVLSFLRRTREAGQPHAKLGSQFYSFLDVLTREASGRSNVVLAVSLPMSEYEMTQDDEAEYQRLDKLLDRLSKPVLLSEKMEIAEIVRRRLFEDIGDPKEVHRTAREYAGWVVSHREQLPGWFPMDQAAQVFEATYPFHPIVLSVFERKWQSLPKFQRTRGVLRMLALWVSRAFQDAFTAARKDPLLSLGIAPLEDSLFRAAVFEQLGEQRLEAAVLSDIAGEEAHAVRMDAAAPDSLRRMRLHQKVVTSVFFESSGGQVRNEATLPEVRLAVGEPDLDIGNVETVLDDLVLRCYYLDAKGTGYWVSHRPTLNKILADRRAILSGDAGEESVRERVRETIRKVFAMGAGPERRYFPESSGDIPDSAALTLVVLSPEHGWEPSIRDTTKKLVTTMIQEYGSRDRTFKSGLLFAVAENADRLTDEARNLLAIESLEDPTERERLGLEEPQLKELEEKKKRSDRDLRENVWRTYRRLLLLAEDGGPKEVDLGLLHSSAAESLVALIVARLKQEGLLEETISPDFLVRNWPPALPEWSTKAVRDTFYASPQFPRLLDPTVLRTTIAEGVSRGKFGYVGKTAAGGYEGPPAIDEPSFEPANVEFSDQVALLPRDTALALQEGGEASRAGAVRDGEREYGAGEPPGAGAVEVGASPGSAGAGVVEAPGGVPRLRWEGDVPSQKWMNFYIRVLTRFATEPTLRIHVTFEVEPAGGISGQKLEEARMALRELGLDDTVDSSEV